MVRSLGLEQDEWMTTSNCLRNARLRKVINDEDGGRFKARRWENNTIGMSVATDPGMYVESWSFCSKKAHCNFVPMD